MADDAQQYTVILCPEGDESGYIALVPALPPCEGHGDTRDEAIANARDAVIARVSELRAARQPLPADDGPWSVTIDVPA